MRSHTRTLDEDVFARFLQAFRKRRSVVQTRQRGFAGKETTPDTEILGISVLDMEHCRFKHEVDVPGLADPQTQNTDFLRDLVFEPVLGGTRHFLYVEVYFAAALSCRIFFKLLIPVVSKLRTLRSLQIIRHHRLTSHAYSNVIYIHFNILFGRKLSILLGCSKSMFHLLSRIVDFL